MQRVFRTSKTTAKSHATNSMIVGIAQFGAANLAFGHKHNERFPAESVQGIKQEWSRLESKCYDFMIKDIGNVDLYDIYRSMQRHIKTCKNMLSQGTSLSIEEVERCHRSVEGAFVQCKAASLMPEGEGEMRNESVKRSEL